MKPIEIDGRVGEGGGQVVRVAICLAALTTQPVIITNVRGNRGGGSQHVTSIRWLAEATDAEVEGLSVGSKTVSFSPRRAASELMQRNIKISADSGAASTLLILQAIFPFLLFSGNHSGDPVELEVSGGTNVSFSLSYDYLDLVLLPVLEEHFGIQVERRLIRRGWSLGPQSRGSFWMKIRPLALGEQLHFKAAAPRTNQGPYEVTNVDVIMVVPSIVHEELQNTLVKDLDVLFPGANVNFKLVEDSHLETRWYILLVAHSKDDRRFGKDYLGSMPKKGKMRGLFTAQVSDKLCRGLFEEVNHGGEVDEHLQDQLICFQALCNGYSSFPRGDDPDEASFGVVIDALGNLDVGDSRMRKEKIHGPFGHGSLHTRTARFVVSELLPAVEFYNKGDLVKGSGLLVESPVDG
ncbi:RNA 3'-terminal phosphate cyclase-domain-containing protein [Dactylonectria estremocensis]|uniref:RNA 3'-terminal phosphate cyclase-domain-containing protein n=1 Tax=Dactylonectria estremocensis TaxID=1079267 RepID=A0A9P9DV35_9HYPO|nr:RNA 3'-terminal phosphate cyclase-domain-containing protein [Dactylonectria estremocensis]